MKKDTTNITIRLDKDLKNQANELFDSLGIGLTEAIRVFLIKCIREQRIPFRISRSSEKNDLYNVILSYINNDNITLDELYALRNMLDESIETISKRR